MVCRDGNSSAISGCSSVSGSAIWDHDFEHFKLCSYNPKSLKVAHWLNEMWSSLEIYNFQLSVNGCHYLPATE